VWGSNVSAKWNTGTDTRIITDFDSHTMTVKRDGETIAKFPTSGGKAEWETATGIKPISEKYEVKRLYNPGPDGWDVTVPWAMRLTYSGEFIHSAPWNGSIGYANTSHGCTNLTVSDAAEVFSSTRLGDPVISRGGNGQPVQSWDTWGGAWAYTWDEWVDDAHITPVM
jgi:lipoprotein-anchoring transpeptidase ErfK/SrfK